MRKIFLAGAAVAATLTLGACSKEAASALDQESTVLKESLTLEQINLIGEAQGSIREARTLKGAYAAYQSKTIDFTPKMREQVDVVYDARFANAVAAAKGNRPEIVALKDYIITLKNRGCVVSTNCENGEQP